MQSDIERIADHYGYETQSRQLIEEMAELTQVINKVWRYENKPKKYICDEVALDVLKDNLIEEIADVQIMLWQMLYLLDRQNDIEQIIEYKIKRQLNRIEMED